MIVTHEVALTLDCCQLQKKCRGNFCMAWRKIMTAPQDHSGKKQRPPAPAPSEEMVDSGLGCCGIAGG